MAPPLLECCDLSCGYPGHAVLSQIDIQVVTGETVVLLGPNGSGKSTLLKSVCKTLSPISGHINLGGRDLASMGHREAATRVGYVPQDEVFRFEFSVREVVTMGRLPLSDSLWDTPEDAKAAEDAMAEADCLHLQDRSVMELSGGEKQRVLIARAIAQGAPLMVLDEPTAHLDVEHQLVVARLARKLAAQGRATVVAIHDLNLATLVGDRAVLIHEGKVGIDAPTEEVLRSPLLDEVYRVRFNRTALASGRLAVFPEAV